MKLCSKCNIGSRRSVDQRYCRLCHNSYMRENRKKYISLSLEQKKRADARSYWHLHMKRKNLKKEPCLNCLGIQNLEAHHSDYNNPLNIIWLCRDCHRHKHTSRWNYYKNKLKFFIEPSDTSSNGG